MSEKIRATRESLLKNAQEFVAEQVRKDFQILAAYLCGSLLEEECLLGGTTDIDLFFVRLDEPPSGRQVRRLTDEVHLDIAYLSQREFRQTRELRVHPWLGPALKGARVLYDPQHFMDFTIAGVRGQFDRADYTHARASRSAESARHILAGLQESQAQPTPANLLRYLRAVAHTANSIAVLSGPPLTDRRFLSHFQARAAAVGRPGLYAGLLGLLGAFRLQPGWLAACLNDWQAAFLASSQQTSRSGHTLPARLHPERLRYYQGAFESQLSGAQPANLLWPLLLTWTLAASQLEPSSSHCQKWERALEGLDLAGPAFTERLAALQAFQYTVEETLQEWRERNGVFDQG